MMVHRTQNMQHSLTKQTQFVVFDGNTSVIVICYSPSLNSPEVLTNNAKGVTLFCLKFVPTESCYLVIVLCQEFLKNTKFKMNRRKIHCALNL
jgi:hypothetical protein